MFKPLMTLIFTCGLLLSLVAQGATAPFNSMPEVRRFTDEIMTKVGAGNIEEALEQMRPYVLISSAEFDVIIAQTRNQMPALRARFGKNLGSEFIGQDQVGDSLLRLVYIAKFERHVLRWMFYFYKTDKGWMLNTFKFDDNLVALFP